jgi:hypothetical protein
MVRKSVALGDDSHGCHNGVRTSGELVQHGLRLFGVCRLAETAAVVEDDSVGSEHDRAGRRFTANATGLGAGEADSVGDRVIPKGLINIGNLDFELTNERREQFVPSRRSRR